MAVTDLAASISAYEEGILDEVETVELFQHLIDTGTAWRLQGSYGRAAYDLIQAGRCMLGEVGHNDAFGSYVPSRTEVKPGAPGSAEYVAEKENDDD